MRFAADDAATSMPVPALLEGYGDAGRLRWSLALVVGFFTIQLKAGVVIGIPLGIWAVSRGMHPDELLQQLTSHTPLALGVLIIGELVVLLAALLASLGFRPLPVGLTWDGAGRSLVMLAPLVLVMAWIVRADPTVSVSAALQSPLLGYVVAACLLVGITEELVFRGLLVGMLGGGRAPFTAAIVSGAMFGAVHMLGLSLEGGALVALTIFGLFGVPFALVYLRTGSILGLALVHAGWDVVVLGSLGIDANSAANSAANAVEWTIVDLSVPAAVSLAYAAWFYATMPNRRPLPNPIRARRERSTVDWDALADDEILNPWVKNELRKAAAGQ